VINPNSNYCYVLNTANDAITDSLFVGKESSGIVIDKNSKVWILTEGSSSNSQKAQLVRINPITLSIELSLTFGETDRPWRLRFNKTRDTLFYLNRGVYTFPIANSQLNMNPIISQGSKLYYGLNINTNNYTIYVSDAIDYVQKSKIEIYDGRGSFIKSFNAGIISNGFIFE
jgi:DNA-binding beta-propeller fold protein YncE